MEGSEVAIRNLLESRAVDATEAELYFDKLSDPEASAALLEFSKLYEIRGAFRGLVESTIARLARSNAGPIPIDLTAGAHAEEGEHNPNDPWCKCYRCEPITGDSLRSRAERAREAAKPESG